MQLALVLETTAPNLSKDDEYVKVDDALLKLAA
jgi:hypothetical protein